MRSQFATSRCTTSQSAANPLPASANTAQCRKFPEGLDELGFLPLPISLCHSHDSGRAAGRHWDPFDHTLAAQAEAIRCFERSACPRSGDCGKANRKSPHGSLRMTRHRIALIGLGMAVTPHAKSLLDLEDRVEVAYAMSPSAARREAFAARFPFPTTGSLDSILEDRSITAVAVLTPPNTHLEIASRACQGRQAHPAREAARHLDGARRAAGCRLPRRGRDAGRRAAAPLQARGGAACRHPAGGRAGPDRQLLDEHPAVAAAELLRRAGPRHQGARRRRRADDAGHSHPRPDAEPGRPHRRGQRLHPHLARASHGDRGPGVRGGALCQRCRRRHRCDDRRLFRAGRSASS